MICSTRNDLGGSAVALALGISIALAAAGQGRAAEPGLAQHPKVADAIRLYDLWAGEQLAYHGVPGVAIGVVHGGELVWARGYGVADLATGEPVTPRTLFRIGSVTKLFTATAILQLRDAGKLRLDDPVARHLPWFRIESPFPDAPAITIEHILTHTSGLPREGAFPYWTTHEFPTRAALRAALPTQSAIHPPGETYKYSNLGMALLGEVVAAVAGEPWATYVQRHILEPLGMTASSAAPDAERIGRLARQHRRKQPDGGRGSLDYYETEAIAPAAAIVSTIEDLARFAALHLAAGPAGPPAGGAQIVAGPTLAEMHRARFVLPSWTSGRGLGFAVSRRDGRTLVAHGGWIGGHRADLVLDPTRRLAVVTLTNADDASPALFGRKALDVVGAAIATATAPPATAPAPPDPSWRAYLGRYTDPWDWESEVLILDGALTLYDHGYPPDDDPDSAIIRLTPTGAPHTFRMSDGETVRFELDDRGEVVRLWRRYEYLTPIRP